MSTTAPTARPTHRYLTSPDTGHRLRLSGRGNVRSVYLVAEEGGLVELGHVTMVTRDTGFAHPIDAIGVRGWAVGSFMAGAFLLDRRIRVTPHTTYALELRAEGETDVPTTDR